jgi:hypothetical protein
MQWGVTERPEQMEVSVGVSRETHRLDDDFRHVVSRHEEFVGQEERE